MRNKKEKVKRREFLVQKLQNHSKIFGAKLRKLRDEKLDYREKEKAKEKQRDSNGEKNI